MLIACILVLSVMGWRHGKIGCSSKLSDSGRPIIESAATSFSSSLVNGAKPRNNHHSANAGYSSRLEKCNHLFRSSRDCQHRTDTLLMSASYSTLIKPGFSRLSKITAKLGYRNNGINRTCIQESAPIASRYKRPIPFIEVRDAVLKSHSTYIKQTSSNQPKHHKTNHAWIIALVPSA